MRIELPSTAPVIEVTHWLPHGCGGYYMHERLAYGPNGLIGRVIK